jgi:hypothetical protein
MKFFFLPLLAALAPPVAGASDLSEAGTRLPGQSDCGPNYMLPGDTAYLGSHTFVILGADDDTHLIAEHRSGTPPHNYQFLLRVRVKPEEMAFYRKLAAESKTQPAFTTIYYDDKSGAQLDRTFFCLHDLPKIFGAEKKAGDVFEKLFPLRASLLKNADHEGDFDVKKTFYPGGHLTIARDDAELLVYRYLPGYLPQKPLREAIKKNPEEMRALFKAAPLFATEPKETAVKHETFARTDGAADGNADECPRDYNLKKQKVLKTAHAFLLLGEEKPGVVLAASYYDQAPHNFQTALRLHLLPDELAAYHRAREGTRIPPLLVTGKVYPFCLATLRKDVKAGTFHAPGLLYRNSRLDDYKPGEPVGAIELTAAKSEVLVNRPLVSFLDPMKVMKDVLGK